MSEKLFIQQQGQRRTAIEVECHKCNAKYLTSKSRPKKYCSQSCFSKDKMDRVKLKCDWCDIEFERKRGSLNNSKSGKRFCQRTCKDAAQRMGGVQEIMPEHYGTRELHYREVFIASPGAKFECRRCGYDEFESVVEIHHLDHDRNNNSIENLVPLCCNCHQAYHRGWISKEQIDK